jgi:hypothetical protein
MKRILAPFAATLCVLASVFAPDGANAQNPYLPLWEHLPDGEPRVFEDPDAPGKYRAYIIGSHDVRFGSYCAPDIRMWSAPVEDLSNWKDEGPIFTYQIDNQWDVMYAPDLVEVRRRDGKREYWLYPHSRGANREPMVAKGDRPDGPFTPVNMTADGRATVPGSVLGFDPSIYVEQITNRRDPDYRTGFRAYGFWGFQRSLAAELDPATMYSVRPGKEVIPYFMPASSRYGEVRDPAGTQYPHLFPGEKPSDYNFFEASSIRRVGNKYLLIYSGYSGPEYGLSSSNSTLRYAFGDTPLGPWKAGGVLVDSRAPVLNETGSGLQTTNGGHNTHGSIEKINDQWYVFYHRPPRGFGFARQAMVAPITIEADEKSVADGGRVSIRGYDPYAADKKWSAKASDGNEYTGAEVTSEGFQVYGLDPYKYYSAGYAAYLSDISTQQDTWDIWDNSMPIAGVAAGHIIGYKYFGFGGLAQATKGLKPFAGTAAGNGTQLNLWLTPRSQMPFRVNVWMDGPWDNAAWKGKKLGTIEVPARSAQELTKFTLDVSKFVDGIGGKHAIYLVAEGVQQQQRGGGGGGRPGMPLFDLMGLGFSAQGKSLERPVAPTVNIWVNGVEVELPAVPVRSTNANGITGYDRYEASVGIMPGTSAVPVVTAKASDPSVKIDITQSSAPGTASVKFDYKGVVKTYNIVMK